MDRRQWMQTAAALAVAASVPRWALAQANFKSNPFRLGVASGLSLQHDGLVLWTRLAPADEILPAKADYAVRWELAEDEAFRRILRRGEALASGQLGHSVHVELAGLPADRWFWYRFMLGDAVSAVGRTRTFVAPGAPLAQLNFAFASCQRWEHGYYAAWRHMQAEKVDFVAFLGDYIYEYASAKNALRSHSLKVARTLADYRDRYALYKSDADLQGMHAACPWMLSWDDHEVENNYAGLYGVRAGGVLPEFAAQRQAAYQAYYENMPLPVAFLRHGTAGFGRNDALRLYQRYRFGQLAQFHVLDDRQYRDLHACGETSGSLDPALCGALRDGGRSLLGMEQEQWLAQGLAANASDGTRWSVIAQQTLFSARDFSNGPGEKYSSDGWDGYPAARQRLLDALVKTPPRNTVIIGGDIHQNVVANVKADFAKPDSAIIASEFCGTSISSQNSTTAKRNQALLAENPHLLLAEAAYRGYALCQITPQRWRTRLRIVDDVRRPDAGIATLAEFVVDDQRPGPRRV